MPRRRRPRVKRINIAPHVRRVKAHHKRGKKKLLQLFHKIRRHPGCYKPGYHHHRGKAPKSLPRKPKGLNKRGSGFWDHVKHAWNWITGHKVVKDMQKEVVKHAKETGGKLVKEYGDRAVSYGKSQMDRGEVWLRRQADAALHKVKSKADKHINDLGNKIEGTTNKIDKFVSGYTGATSDMPGRTVAAKKGSGWAGAAGRIARFPRFRRRMRAAGQAFRRGSGLREAGLRVPRRRR